MTDVPNPRALALDILTENEKEGAYSHLLIRQMLEKYQYLKKQDRALITRLAEGTIENRLYIDVILDTCSKLPVRKMKPVIRNILRMGVYQIIWLDRIPDSAACNEAVKLTEKRGFHQLKGFVNGILRRIVREKAQWTPEKLKERYAEDPVQYLSLRYSVPEWLIKDWQAVYPYDIIETILQGMYAPAPTTVRLQTDFASEEEILESLCADGCQTVRCEAADGVFYVSGYDHLEALKAFQNGWIMVQDASSVLAGLTAAPKAGDLVLDVCAAPGGKSLHAASLLRGTGMVEARDISEYKIAYLNENIRRMRLTNIRTKVWDAAVLDESMRERADIVIADLPCSGLGVLGNKSDLKYRMTAEKQTELVRLQKQILTTAAAYIKPGGYLVYSTCTINRRENEEMVFWMTRELGLTPVDISPVFAKLPACTTAKDGYQQLLPGIHKTAGFFISKLRKGLS